MLLQDFSTIITSDTKENSQETTLKINQEHSLYQGHFPNNPVTPGVVIINLFKEEAEHFYKRAFQIYQAKNVKFMAVVNPMQTPILKLNSSFQENEEEVIISGTASIENEIAVKLKLILKKL